MPKVVFTHPVSDTAHWASKHSERVEAFASWGSNVVDYLSADGSSNVAVSVDVHDLAECRRLLTRPRSRRLSRLTESWSPLRSTSRKVESRVRRHPTTWGSLTSD